MIGASPSWEAGLAICSRVLSKINELGSLRPGTFVRQVCLLPRPQYRARDKLGGRHEENFLSDGRSTRIRCTFLRSTTQNCRASATIRCILVLRGSRYRVDDVRNCRTPAWHCSWCQHEGYRCGSSDAGISGTSHGGRQNLHTNEVRARVPPRCPQALQTNCG